jgi:hypothetical protein
MSKVQFKVIGNFRCNGVVAFKGQILTDEEISKIGPDINTLAKADCVEAFAEPAPSNDVPGANDPEPKAAREIAEKAAGGSRGGKVKRRA